MAKPLVDGIMNGNALAIADDAAHHAPGLSALSLADLNYITGCYLDPTSCS